MIKPVFFLFMAFSIFSLTAETPVKEIEKIEAVYYSPGDDKLRDLVCDIRISNLEDFIRHQLKLSRTEDVHFKVYWVYPDTYRVEINGLPDGFDHLKDKLRQQVTPLLGYIIPKKISVQLNNYEKKVIKEKEMIVIMGSDKTGHRDINEIKMIFDKDKRFKRLETFGLGGAYTSSFKTGKKPWSRNRWVVEQVRVENRKGVFVTSTTHTIEYKSQGAFGFPRKITTQTRLESDSGKKKEIHGRHESTITLENYVINSGQAKKYMEAVKK